MRENDFVVTMLHRITSIREKEKVLPCALCCVFHCLGYSGCCRATKGVWSAGSNWKTTGGKSQHIMSASCWECLGIIQVLRYFSLGIFWRGSTNCIYCWKSTLLVKLNGRSSNAGIADLCFVNQFHWRSFAVSGWRAWHTEDMWLSFVSFLLSEAVLPGGVNFSCSVDVPESDCVVSSSVSVNLSL